jgi:amino acid adenylation domain-containing protein
VIPLPFPKTVIDRPITTRFEQVADQFPMRIAIKHNAAQMSYAELNKFANRIACALVEQVGREKRPIALLLGHDLLVAPALLGALKAGRPYSVLDPSHPVARNRAILLDLGATALLADSRHSALAWQIAAGSCPIIDVTQLDSGKDECSVAIPVGARDLAGIYYTSGTTGQPKGVMRSHQFILHRIWLETAANGISPTDHFSLMHGFSYGASVTDTFNTWLNGATLHLYDVRERGVAPLIRWLNEEAITFFHAPSAVFRQFVSLLTENDLFPTLRQITPSGRLYRSDVAQIRRNISAECIIIQRLASTETGMITQLRLTADNLPESNVIPVGYPVPGKTVTLVDEHGDPVASGAVGEIRVESRYLAAGYWQQPELTARTFRPNPDDPTLIRYQLGDLGRFRPDGCLELIGRKDAQVKIRGFRVELGEIEAALLALPAISAATVVAREDVADNKRLVAYVVADDHLPPAGMLRQTLANMLPEYMLPSTYVALDEMPLTDRGKLDLAALPEPGRARPALSQPYVAPGDLAESILATIWAKTLALEPIGVHDNFFELGGQSIAAAQVAAEAGIAFEREISLRMVFDYPTIATFCSIVQRAVKEEKPTVSRTLDEQLKLLGY